MPPGSAYAPSGKERGLKVLGGGLQCLGFYVVLPWKKMKGLQGGNSPLTLRSSFHERAFESIVSILVLLIFEVLRNRTYRDDSSYPSSI